MKACYYAAYAEALARSGLCVLQYDYSLLTYVQVRQLSVGVDNPRLKHVPDCSSACAGQR